MSKRLSLRTTDVVPNADIAAGMVVLVMKNMKLVTKEKSKRHKSCRNEDTETTKWNLTDLLTKTLID